MFDKTILNIYLKTNDMLKEIEKVLDIESVNTFIQKTFKGINGIEALIQRVAAIKVLDFLIVGFKPEYDLQGIWYEQDVSQVKRRLERCVTIEKKKAFLETKLNEQEILFNEHEYFDILEDFKDDTIGDLFNKVNQLKFGFQKTSRWQEADEEDKVYLALIGEIPNTLPSIDVFENLTKQKARSFILSRPTVYNFFIKLMRLKRGEIPPSKLIIGIISDIFSIYYASKLNVYLREEYKKLIPTKDYQLIGNINEDENISGRKIEILLPKIKQRLANDGITSLSIAQTAMLFNMLRGERIIFKDESFQSKENIYKAIQILTGYSNQNMKVEMNNKDYDNSDRVVVQNILRKLLV